jgi:hypothetical protein
MTRHYAGVNEQLYNDLVSTGSTSIVKTIGGTITFTAVSISPARKFLFAQAQSCWLNCTKVTINLFSILQSSKFRTVRWLRTWTWAITYALTAECTFWAPCWQFHPMRTTWVPRVRIQRHAPPLGWFWTAAYCFLASHWDCLAVVNVS